MSTTFESRLAQLNPAQRKAVETLQGPVLVVAGPGTGKTQVLAMRIANILRTTDTAAGNVLCLTFTESGVVAMRERLIQIIGNDAYRVRIHTFHSFAGEVIQSFPQKFAFARELSQLGDLERVKIIRSILDSLPKDQDYELRPFYNAYAYQSDILSAITDLKREGTLVDGFARIAQAEFDEVQNSPELNSKTGKPTAKWTTSLRSARRNLELAEIYALYQEALKEQGLYDYEDMILFLIDQFQKDDELLAHYQERYLYVLVDEYQDTNGAQNEIIKLLGSFDKSPNIFAVGDDDQAIYRFQGASVENLLSFNKMFAGVQTIAITQNYRSTQNVLDAADGVIAHNEQRLASLLPDLDKSLTSNLTGAGSPVAICEFNHYLTELTFLTKKITELSNNGEEFTDIAILYRKHSDAEDVASALLHAGIPVQLAAGDDALQERSVHKLISLLKVVDYSGTDRDQLLFEILFYPFLELSRVDVFKLTRFAGDKKLGLMDLLLDLKKLEEIELDDPVKLYNFAQRLIAWKELDANSDLSTFIERIAKESGFLEYVFGNRGADTDIEDIVAINSVYDYIKQASRLHPGKKLRDLLSDIELLQENRLGIKQQEVDSGTGGVRLMTAHAAKGLEFKHVFIIKAYDGNWGGRRSRRIIKLPGEIFGELAAQHGDVDTELEDERRLFFVAMTRAKQNLYISSAGIYPSGNDTKQVSPSQFVSEIPSKSRVELETTDYQKADLSDFQKQLSPVEMPAYTQAESAYLKSLLAKFRLSASALNEYMECPLKFKFNRLLKVPHPQLPVLALGTGVHYALEQFYRQLMAGQQKNLGYVLSLFAGSIEKELLSSEDKQSTLTEGKKLLSDYFQHYHSDWEVPIEVEYGFYSSQILLEPPRGQPILLSGKLDKLTWVDKQKYHVRVTDYKTTTPKSANDIRGLTKGSDGHIFRQLVFYRLLAELDDRFRPAPNLPKYKVTEVEVDFIKPNSGGKFKREVFEITDQDVQELKETIFDVMGHIRELDFAGSEAYPVCGECEYCQMFGAKGSA
ncbi:ATP-dependent helicase [Candidatus Dojkabacteria bacterium]|uniref:DNA 3'-5' helicase n=1 Tax=Candidatus Dojkabacteria bacterium TaxID=2099670 RepID=A0A955I947_9BACT|nr:ATP-dependent helicase [Candidatus Dojkabacteria bacterium]